MKHPYPHNGKWLIYDTADPRLNKAQHAEMAWRIEEYKKNKLAAFIPHGLPWSDEPQDIMDMGKVVIPPRPYPKALRNDGTAFLSDYDSDMCLILGPNQVGKSVLLAIWNALRLIPCDKSWSIFKNSGVVAPEWHGPRILAMGSYSWDNVDTLWKRMREFWPAYELGEYAPGGKRTLAFASGRLQRLELACGSEVRFMAYTQAQEHFEGFNCHLAGYDEQVPKEAWIGVNRGMTTSGDNTQSAMALTGHAVKGRPDTGNAGWVKRDLYDGNNRMGMKVGIYHLSVASAPDAIITPKKRKALYDQWVNPKIERSKKEEREGVARFLGGWEEAGGLMLDDFSRNVHVIPPLWVDDKPPIDATLFRVIDHGETKPTCCSWFAIIPPRNKWVPYSFAVTYRMLYERNARPAIAVPEIIRMSGNLRQLVRTEHDDVSGTTFEIYEEIVVREDYQWTMMDSRSMAMPRDGTNIGQMYARYGLQCRSAKGTRNAMSATLKRGQLDFFRDWLRSDISKKHIVTGKWGAPRWYVFDLPCTRPLVSEIESWRRSDNDPEQPASNQDDHAIDTHKFFFADEPCPDLSKRYQDGEPEDRQTEEPPCAPHMAY